MACSCTFLDGERLQLPSAVSIIHRHTITSGAGIGIGLGERCMII